MVRTEFEIDRFCSLQFAMGSAFLLPMILPQSDSRISGTCLTLEASESVIPWYNAAESFFQLSYPVIIWFKITEIRFQSHQNSNSKFNMKKKNFFKGERLFWSLEDISIYRKRKRECGVSLALTVVKSLFINHMPSYQWVCLLDIHSVHGTKLDIKKYIKRHNSWLSSSERKISCSLWINNILAFKFLLCLGPWKVAGKF